MDTMNSTTPAHSGHPVGRRQLLRTGGLAMGAGAILAACGEPGDTGLARIGEAPTTTALSEGKVTDQVLMRTSAALELNFVDAYDRILDAGHVTDAEAVALLGRFRAAHAANAARFAAYSATEVAKKNERIDSLYFTPALAAVETADDKETDTLALAHAMECLGAATQQAFVAWLAEKDNRRKAIEIGAEESRNAAELALLIRPGLDGVLPETSEDGSPVISAAAVPAAFGSLAGVDVQLGAPSETGSRETYTFETPSLNTLEYLD